MGFRRFYRRNDGLVVWLILVMLTVFAVRGTTPWFWILPASMTVLLGVALVLAQVRGDKAE